MLHVTYSLSVCDGDRMSSLIPLHSPYSRTLIVFKNVIAPKTNRFHFIEQLQPTRIDPNDCVLFFCSIVLLRHDYFRILHFMVTFNIQLS